MNKLNLKNGIKFSCQSSGNCCVSRGKYGYVYLSQKDLKKLSSHFNLEINDFKKQYCSKTDGFIHLKELKKNNGNCIFLNEKRCTVYKSRPVQCRTWPFWNENMNAKTWNNNISKNCPGIGKGKIIKKDQILKFLKQDKDNEISTLNE